jgi:DNA-binding transcriptional regulator GbsR (MarR family)
MSSVFKPVVKLCPDPYGLNLILFLKNDDLHRRRMFIAPPNWLLMFKSPIYNQSKKLQDITFQLLAKLSKNKSNMSTFHHYSGKLTSILHLYVSSIVDFSKQRNFIDKYISFMKNETDKFPRNVDRNQKLTYDDLKDISIGNYGSSLKTTYVYSKEHSLTQDYIFLYKVPKDLIEDMLQVMSSEEIVNYLETYR